MLGGVTLKHWTDTNRFAGIENKQTQSAPLQGLGSTSACSQDPAPARELPLTDGCARASQGAAPAAVPEQLLPKRARQNLGKSYFQMDQTQSYRERCALRVSQASQKGTSTELKYSYGNAWAATKNNPSTGKKHRTVVTTYFCISVDRKCNTKKGTFLDHRVLKLLTSTKENAFAPSRCFCHLPGDERNMKP